ncbi:MAG: hypothetical protein PHS41_11060 [Victivallaceae bacterium]|nr:hypothetical protein [Victivallaceae bacterium]
MATIKKFFCCCLGLVAVTGLGLFATESELSKTVHPRRVDLGSIFSGKIEYARRNFIAFESAGLLTYVARPGVELPGAVFDGAGRIVSHGGLLARQDDIVQRANFAAAEAKLREAEVALAEKKENFERDSKLASKNAVSMRQFLESRIAYESAVWSLAAARAERDRTQRLIEGRSQSANFPCLVESVTLASGTVADVAQLVMTIASVEAMKLEIKLPSYAVRLLDQSTPILVYPSGAGTPVAGWFDLSGIGADSLVCYVDNPLVIEPAEGKWQGMPAVSGFTFLFPPMPSTKNLAPVWVMPAAVMCDGGNNNFVWKLEGLRALETAAALPRELTLRKIPVARRNLFFDQGIYRLEGIAPEKPADLSPFDLVATRVSGPVTDGGKAVYRAEKRLFLAGEHVAVQIKFPAGKPFWKLPRRALQCGGKSGFFVRIFGDSGVENIPVEIREITQEEAVVTSPGLNAESEVVVN